MMSAFDKRGEHVEKLASWTREELAEARYRTQAVVWRWKRAKEEKQRRLDEAKRWYEEMVRTVEWEAEQAPEKLAEAEARLAELDEIGVRIGASAREGQQRGKLWEQARRQQRVSELLGKLTKGTEQEKLEAARELKGLMMGG